MNKFDVYPHCEERQELANFEAMERHQIQCSDLIDAISDLSKDVDGCRYRVPVENALDLEWLEKTYQDFRDWADMLACCTMDDDHLSQQKMRFEVLGDDVLERDQFDDLCDRMGW